MSLEEAIEQEVIDDKDRPVVEWQLIGGVYIKGSAKAYVAVTTWGLDKYRWELQDPHSDKRGEGHSGGYGYVSSGEAPTVRAAMDAGIDAAVKWINRKT